MKILAVCSDDDGVASHLLDAVDAVLQGKLLDIAVHKIDCEQICGVPDLRSSPAAAGAVKDVAPDEAVLERVALRLWKLSITIVRS